MVYNSFIRSFQFLIILFADEHFFYNSEYLARFSACPESKKSSVPGHAYFNKISAFMKAHVQVGEIYLLSMFRGSVKEMKVCESGSFL